MDPDPWIRILIIFVSLTALAYLARVLRTALMSSVQAELPADFTVAFAEKESAISRLSLLYSLIKTGFIAAAIATPFPQLFLRATSGMVQMGAVLFFLVLLLLFDILSAEVADRRGAHHPERVLLRLKGLLSLFLMLSKPLYVVYTITKKILIHLLHLPPVTPKVTVDQILMMVQRGEKQGIINAAEKEMIDSVMGFNDTVAEEIMTPRTEVFMLEVESSPEQYLEDLMVDRYSRIPVYEGDIDNIIGVLYLKDFFAEAWKLGFSNVDIRKILRPAYFVPERKNVHTLFQEMQRAHRHMAILMDEYGGFSGVITMEDLTEEIMGEIDDEFDADEPEFYELTTNTAVVQGTTSIKDLNDLLDIHIPDDTDDYDTIAGFIIFHLGYIPEDHRIGTIEYENLRIRVLEVEDRRIKKVKIIVLKSDTSPDTAGGELGIEKTTS